MPKCGHSFHLSCIDVWLRKQSTCPVCRLSVQDSFEAKYVHPTTRRTTQSFDDSEIPVEQSQHSQIWLLPAGQRPEGSASTTSPANSVTINVESSISGAAASRHEQGESVGLKIFSFSLATLVMLLAYALSAVNINRGTGSAEEAISEQYAAGLRLYTMSVNMF